LDGVRGIAALMVMWHHYFDSEPIRSASPLIRFISRFAGIGQTGVDLFFVLSGFLITRILLGTKSEPRYFEKFYVRRSLRILPLYYVFLLLFLYVQPRLVGSKPPDLSSCWWWLVYLQNIPLSFGIAATGPIHYWSLAIEEHFYLFWPLLVFLISRRALAAVCIALIPASIVLRAVLLRHGVDVYFFTLTRLDAISLGSLLAVIEPVLTERPVDHHRWFLRCLAAIFLLLVPVYLVFSNSNAFWLQAIKYTIFGLFFFFLLGFLITNQEDTAYSRFLSSAPMRFVGRISYGLYVYHGLCFFWVWRLFPNHGLLLLLPVAFGLVITVSYVSFRYMESPFLRLKR